MKIYCHFCRKMQEWKRIRKGVYKCIICNQSVKDELTKYALSRGKE